MDEVKNGLFVRAVDIMGKALSLRLSKHNLTATNLANMDVPGYRVRDLKFEKTLQQALESPDGRLTLRRTSQKHLPFKDAGRAYEAAQNKVEYSVYGRDEKGRDLLDIDQEMNKLAKNQLMYNATVQMLAKEFELLKHAISEGGR